jgi:hypothetical protein
MTREWSLRRNLRRRMIPQPSQGANPIKLQWSTSGRRPDAVDLAVFIGGLFVSWWTFWQLLDLLGPGLCEAGLTFTARIRVNGRPASPITAASYAFVLIGAKMLSLIIGLWRRRRDGLRFSPDLPATNVAPRAALAAQVAIALAFMTIFFLPAAREGHCPELSLEECPPDSAELSADRQNAALCRARRAAPG